LVLRERYGRYFSIGRGFARVIGKPAIMGAATKFLLPRPVVMNFAMRLMANLTDGRDGDIQDKMIYVLERVAKAS
jgi:menaquinone-9 beta-reductase